MNSRLRMAGAAAGTSGGKLHECLFQRPRHARVWPLGFEMEKSSLHTEPHVRPSFFAWGFQKPSLRKVHATHMPDADSHAIGQSMP